MNKTLLILLLLALIYLFPRPALAAASLSFSPASQSVAKGDQFSTDIVLNTGGSESDGADVIVMYDGNKLQVVTASIGSLYANKMTADTGTSGRVVLRATSSENQSFNGTGTFATLTFKAIAQGTANTYFDFTSGSTTDSNVAWQGADILGSTSGGSYTVGAASTGGTSASIAPTASPSIPVSGTSAPTILLLAGGLMMLFLGTGKLVLRKIG